MSDSSESSEQIGADQSQNSWAANDIIVVQLSGLKRTIAGTAVGNMVEWFDFGVYGFIAATLGRVFFPDSNTSVQLLSTFALFGAAFIVRPLGGCSSVRWAIGSAASGCWLPP
jgi:MFS transporter, MHS family, proline/betaine transporter